MIGYIYVSNGYLLILIVGYGILLFIGDDEIGISQAYITISSIYTYYSTILGEFSINPTSLSPADPYEEAF